MILSITIDKYVNNGYSEWRYGKFQDRWKLCFFFKENFKTEKHNILHLLF